MEASQIGLTWSAVTVAGLALYKVFRPMLKVNVNCWFCNDNFKVKFSERNSWICPGCCQYNGFTSDGDYNRDIPDQNQNSDVVKFAVQSSEPDKESGNGLCQTCNLNQELKVYQLQKFVPSHPDRFDDEVLEYQQHLERTYRLCRYCEATLHQKLGEQDSWLKPKLLAAKLELSRRSPIQFGRDARNDDVIQRRTILLLSFALFVGTFFCDFVATLNDFPATSTFGFPEIVTSSLLTVLTVYGLRPWTLINHGCHQAAVLAWILLFSYASNENVVSANFVDSFANKSVVRSVAAFLVTALSFLVCKMRASEDRKAEKAKRIKKSSYPKVTFSHRTMQPIEESDKTLTHDLLSTTSTSVSSAATLKTAKSQQSPTRPPIRAPQFGPLLSNHEFHQSEEKELTALSFNSENDADQPVNPVFNNDSGQPVNPVFKTAMKVSELHIDRTGSIGSTGRSPPFEVRRYDAGSNSGIIFGYSRNLDRPVLKPPRFVYEQPRRVAQSSWVAGGYWHQNRSPSSTQNLGVAPENLSRSSSQTSGFFSASNEPVANYSGFIRSNEFASLPNSRVNSICGGDRHSVLSEPVYNNFGKTDFSLQSMGNQLAFYDLSRADNKLRHLDDDDSDSSIGRLSQEAYTSFKPRAESSPLEKHDIFEKSSAKKQSILEKKIEISFSLSSLLLAISLTLNLGVIWYLVVV